MSGGAFLSISCCIHSLEASDSALFYNFYNFRKFVNEKVEFLRNRKEKRSEVVAKLQEYSDPQIGLEDVFFFTNSPPMMRWSVVFHSATGVNSALSDFFNQPFVFTARHFSSPEQAIIAS